MATVTIGEFNETEIYEAIITKVNAAGEKNRRKKCPEGFKLVGNTCQKINAQERVSRSRSAKRAARKRISMKATIKRKTAKAKKYRARYGL